MTSKDVLASTIRFAKISADRGTFSSLDRFETPDDGTFVVKLTKRIPVFIEEFSSFRVPIAIHPADGAVKDAGKLGKTVGAGDLEAIEVTPGGKIDYVGTGPFEFVEWVADSHVKMKRFEGYKARTDFDNRTGFGGHKVACLDTVTFRIVKESGARVAGIETGELDAADTIPPKAAQRLKDNKGIKFLTLENWWLQVAFINHQRVPTNDLKIRRAIQIGLNMEEIMEIATDGNYNLQPGYQYPGNPYYTNAGKEYYNKADVAQAKKLIKGHLEK